MRHELPRDLRGEFVIETAPNVDIAQFRMFGGRVVLQCFSLDVEVGAFGISL